VADRAFAAATVAEEAARQTKAVSRAAADASQRARDAADEAWNAATAATRLAEAATVGAQEDQAEADVSVVVTEAAESTARDQFQTVQQARYA
jgi:hypothetical protein